MTLFLRQFQRELFMFFSLFALILLSLLPVWSSLGVVPNFLSAILYLWTIYRPDLPSNRLYFLLGLLRDALFGYHLGVSIIEILLMVTIIHLLRRYIIHRSFWIIYFGYALFTLCNQLFLWGLLSYMRETVLPLDGPLLGSLFNIFLYPTLSLVSLRLQEYIDKLEVS